VENTMEVTQKKIKNTTITGFRNITSQKELE
jgi:hypothetical protein